MSSYALSGVALVVVIDTTGSLALQVANVVVAIAAASIVIVH